MAIKYGKCVVFVFKMVPLAGVEPATHRLKAYRSTVELQGHSVKFKPSDYKKSLRGNGQYIIQAFPTIFSRGIVPQFLESLLETRLSPKTKNSPSGTVTSGYV